VCSISSEQSKRFSHAPSTAAALTIFARREETNDLRIQVETTGR
jgi:hypothetical protein